jgi:hypothetical protein
VSFLLSVVVMLSGTFFNFMLGVVIPIVILIVSVIILAGGQNVEVTILPSLRMPKGLLIFVLIFLLTF